MVSDLFQVGAALAIDRSIWLVAVAEALDVDVGGFVSGFGCG